MVFCELLENTGCGNVVFLGNGNSGSALKHFLEAFQVSFVSGSAEDGVLHDGILNTCFAEFTAKDSVVCDVDAFVFDEDAGNGVIQLCSKCLNLRLLLFKYFFTGHGYVSPPGK